jgi:hypothetical protein
MLSSWYYYYCIVNMKKKTMNVQLSESFYNIKTREYAKLYKNTPQKSKSKITKKGELETV